MINANDLLRTIRATGAEGYNHKKLCDLLCGIKGTFTKKDIQLVRKVIKDNLTTTDKLLQKLENEPNKSNT
jgi:hypothetical protein